MSEGAFIIPDYETINAYAESMEVVSDEVNSQVERFNSDLSALEYDVEKFVNDVKARLMELQSAIQEMQAEIDELQAKINHYEECIEQNKQKIEQIKGQENQIKIEIQQLEDEIRRLEQSEDSDKAQKIAELRQKIMVLTERLKIYAHHRRELEELNVETTKKLNELKITRAEIVQKQEKYIVKHQEIQKEANSFYTNWQKVVNAFNNANVSNIITSANEELRRLSSVMKQFAQKVSEIEWGYSDV